RTVLFAKERAWIQAGAGIVADSEPEREYQETLNKAAAMLRAVEMAEGGLDMERGPTTDDRPPMVGS
ncbi:MAG: chorismate-binding protein, partial [Candidatus Methylomirabilales bacterium]